MTDMPSMTLRASILKLQFTQRAIAAPVSTLIQAVLKTCQEDQHWVKLTRGEQMHCDLSTML